MFKKVVTILSSIVLALGGSSLDAVDIEKMSIDEKIGQMLCLDFRFWNQDDLDQTEDIGIISSDGISIQKPVTEINDEIREIIKKYHIGGVVLFSQNFESKEQAKKLIDDLQKASKDSGNPPLFICIDQEGGMVERFAFDREKLKNNSEIKTAREAFEKGKIIGKELKELGINCNFAPVVDVNSNPQNPVINVRSFGNNANIVSEFGKYFMQGLHSQNVISTAKHFPGHGDTDVDSHLDLPSINKTLEEIKTLELKPFKTMIDSGVDMIMTAHIELPKIEGNKVASKKDGKDIFLPATVSKIILTDLLRNEMGFKGVIVTDAMNMKAISDNFGEMDAIKLAIKAGADMLLMPVTVRSKEDIKKLDLVIKTLKSVLDNQEISKKQIDESIGRLLKLKKRYCEKKLSGLKT